MGQGHRCALRGIAPTSSRARRQGIWIPCRSKVWSACGTCPKNQGVVEQRVATDKVREVCPRATDRGQSLRAALAAEPGC